MRIDNPISDNAIITGSFTGSFKGDGTNLTGITAEWDGSHTGDASITGALTVGSLITAGVIDGVDVSDLKSNFDTDSAKLAGIESGAEVNTVTSVASKTGAVSLVKGDVGLGNVDNTSDANKPVSTAGQTALDLKANLASPTFTGTVAGVTATHVGLGNVTNESKATMFSSPTFTGTVAGVTATHVGLGNVDNTSDANKPVSTAGQTALDLKANLASPTFTGTPLSTTPSSNDSSTKIATTAYVQGEITDLIGGAGAAFDTLLEISASIANGDSDVVALTTTVGGKLTKADNLSDLTNTGTARTNLGVAIGTDVQAYNSTLAAVAGGTYSGDDSITTLGTVTTGNVSAILPAGTVSGSVQVRAAVEAATDSNVFTDADHAKLNAIEASATADQTAAEIRALVGTGNGNFVPAAGTAGHFLKHDGTFGLPSYTVNTDTTYTAGTGLTLTGTVFSNDITNNNQLTNGAGYITSYVNTTYSAGTGVTLTGTTFSIGQAVATTSDVSFASVTATGNITAYSDARLKKDVKTIEGALAKTNSLRGVEFTRIADDAKSIGVIAQELEAVLPELVATDDEGMKSVNYAQITGLLIEAVKELSAKVDELSK